MKDWLRISLQLCACGFFNGLQPSAHFTFRILLHFREETTESSYQFLAQISYWKVGLGLFAFLLTDMSRYKPMIILSAISGLLFHATLRWTTESHLLLLTSFLGSLCSVTDVAYFTYIYAKVERSHYQQVTSNSRSAVLIGRCLGGLISQYIVLKTSLPAEDLIYISLANKGIALIIAASLPTVSTSIYFYQPKVQQMPRNMISYIECGHPEKVIAKNGDPPLPLGDVGESDFSWHNAKRLLWQHFRAGYSNNSVLRWSCWWILLETGFGMVNQYVQPLWHSLEPDREVGYNGLAEMSLTLFGAIGAQLAGLVNQDYTEKNYIWFMFFSSAIMAVITIFGGITKSVFMSYAAYILCGAVYNFIATITSGIVAKNLTNDSFALIFGINTWLSQITTMIFTFVVVSNVFFSFDIVEQFMIYGTYFVALAVFFCVLKIFETKANVVAPEV